MQARLSSNRSRSRRTVTQIEALESRIAPAGLSVASIVRAGDAAAETSAGSVDYTVTFSDAVSGVDAADFKVFTGGTAGASAAVTVTPVNLTTYTVTVGGLHGQGDVRLDLVDNDTIASTGGALGGVGMSNGSFTGEVYHLLQTFPKVASITANGSATSIGAPSVSWTVTLSAPVMGVDPGDFSLLKNGVSTDTAVTVTGSDSTYTVTATGVSGSGTLALQLVDNGTIRDARGNPLQRTAPPAFTALTEPATGDYPNSVAVADLNADGRPDLVTTNQSAFSISVLMGDGSGGFGTRTDYSVGSYPDCVAVADLNGDSKPDLVTSNSNNNSVSVRLGDGTGAFGAQTFVATGSKPHFVAVGDLNRDGKPDLVTVSYVDHTVSVLLGNGSGGFAAKMDFATGNAPYGVAVTDLNGDGKLDVVTANSGVNSVSVLLGNGDGSLAARTDFATGSVPYSVTVAAFNADGRPDLATANYSANTVSVLLGDGQGGFGTKTDFATGSLPTFATVSDVNGDGRLDLAVANSGGNTVSLLLGDGSGGFAAQTTFAAKTTPRSLAVADVNGDGRADFVITNSGSDNVSVLTSAGAGIITGQSITIQPPSVSVTISPASVEESSTSGLVYTFTRTGDTSAPLALNFTKAGTAAFTTDFTAASSGTLDFANGTLTIPAGSAAATVTLTPVNDVIVEGTESVTLTLANNAAYTVTGSPAAGAIADNDTATLSFVAATSSPLEGAGSQRIGVQLVITANGIAGTGKLGSAVSVRVEDLLTGSATAGAGNDYTFPATATVTFAAGTGSTTFNADLILLNDTVVEGTETVNFALNTLNDPTGQVTLGGTLAHTASIVDNDTAFVRFRSSDDLASERSASQGIDVELVFVTNGSGTGTLGKAVTVNVQDLLAGTAATGADYTFTSPQTVTFAVGSAGAPQSVVLSVQNDALVEGLETVKLALNTLNDPTGQVTIGSAPTQTVTILDDDTATIGFSAPSSSVAESAGSDVLGFTLTITPGDGSTGPAGLARDVTFQVIATGGTATAGSEYALPALVTFTAGGSLTQTANLAIFDDAAVEHMKTVSLGLMRGTDGTGRQVALATGAAASHTTTITDDDTATVTLSGGISQSEGDDGGTVYHFTATLDHAVQGGFSVAYSTGDGTATSADSDYIPRSGSLTFTGLAGETQTFTVFALGDTKFETDETFTVALGALSGAPAGVSADTTAQTATIANDDAIPTISIAGLSVAEGSPGGAVSLATFEVTLSNASAEEVTVDFATADGTAVAPGDYTAIPHGTLTFAPGETKQTITVGIRPDTLFESGVDETFLVKLSNPTHATVGVAQGVGVITSDDGAPAHTLLLDAKHPRTFFDHNHDKVTVRLTGLGTGTLILDGGVLDGADISEINLDSNAAKSALSITVVKDRATGDGLVTLGEVTVAGGLASFSGPAVDFTVGGLHATGAVKTITAHSLARGEIITGGLAADKLALTLGGALGTVDSFVIATPQTISVLKVASIGAGRIEAAALTSISVTAGSLAADITSPGAIGSLAIKGGGVSGDLVASRFGAVTVTGGPFNGSLTSLTPLATLGKTLALTSLSVTGGDLSGDVNLAGGSGALTVRTGSLSGHLAAASFGAVSITGGSFNGTLGATKALASLTVTNGNLSGVVEVVGASGPLTVRGGGFSGGSSAASFGAVSVTGGDFSGTLTSLTPAETLRATKALTSLSVTDGNLTGDIRLLGTSGAITVTAKPALLDAGSIRGASIVAKAIASLTVARDFADSIVLAGADLGADHALGGGDDRFDTGTIGAVKIGRNVAGAGSMIGAGFNPTDGAIRDSNDAIVGGVASSIASLTVSGTAGQETYFAAGLFKTPPRIAGAVVRLPGDVRFLVG